MHIQILFHLFRDKIYLIHTYSRPTYWYSFTCSSLYILWSRYLPSKNMVFHLVEKGIEFDLVKYGIRNRWIRPHK